MNEDEKKLLQDKIDRLEEVLYFIPGNVFWKEVDGKYLGCNASVAKLLGFTSSAQIVGKTNYDFFDKELAERITQNDEVAYTTKQSITLEEVGVDAEGNEAIYLTTKVPLLNKQYEVIGLVGNSTDITSMKKLEEELRITKLKAEEANAAKTEFLRNMSHDLRTPFNSLINLTQYLKKSEVNSEKKQYLEYMEVSAQKLLEIINQIVEVVKLEGSQLPVQSELFKLPEIFNSVKFLMLPELHNVHLEFDIVCDENLPASLIGDTIRIHRIILNLISNAIRFTQKGKITLQAKVLEKQSDKIKLAIIVEDTGIGISEDKFEFIFGRFNRISSSYHGIFSGMGLGLSIVKQFVDELAGTISVESQLNKGSKFTVTLELAYVT